MLNKKEREKSEERHNAATARGLINHQSSRLPEALGLHKTQEDSKAEHGGPPSTKDKEKPRAKQFRFLIATSRPLPGKPRGET